MLHTLVRMQLIEICLLRSMHPGAQETLASKLSIMKSTSYILEAVKLFTLDVTVLPVDE